MQWLYGCTIFQKNTNASALYYNHPIREHVVPPEYDYLFKQHKWSCFNKSDACVRLMIIWYTNHEPYPSYYTLGLVSSKQLNLYESRNKGLWPSAIESGSSVAITVTMNKLIIVGHVTKTLR